MNIFCSFAFPKKSLMSKAKLLLFFMVGSIIVSCTSKKNILYMQDIDVSETYIKDYNEYIVKVDDILKIDVNSDTPEASLIFNSSNSEMNNRESLLFYGYQVDIEGYINFPSLGKIKVSGNTIKEIRTYIYNTIKDKGLLIEPYVDVKLMNAHFTIVGEINKPGRYEFLKNNMNILEAIGIGGDLTINGQRENLKLIRDNNGKKSVYSINLTKSDFLTGENFQVFSGDIIIVNPNRTRVKNAGIIGNSGTLLSLLSFILSSIIVISN